MLTKELFRELFCHSNGTGKAFQQPDGTYRFDDHAGITDEDIARHFSGHITLALPVVFGDKCKFAVIDIDITSEYHQKSDYSFPDFKLQVDEMINRCKQHATVFGLADCLYWEYSGFKGAHGWIFFRNYVPTEKAYQFISRLFDPFIVPAVSDAIKIEFCPSSTRPGRETIKAPWGVHQKSGGRSEWVADSPPDKQHVQFVSEAQLDEIMSIENSMLGACGAIRNLAIKARELNHLEHSERFAVAALHKEFDEPDFADCGVGGLDYVVQNFIGHCSDYDSETTRYQYEQIRHKGYKPVTCSYLQGKGICQGTCAPIKTNKSPITFAYRAKGDYKNLELIDSYPEKYDEAWLAKKFISQHGDIGSSYTLMRGI